MVLNASSWAGWAVSSCLGYSEFVVWKVQPSILASVLAAM